MAETRGWSSVLLSPGQYKDACPGRWLIRATCYAGTERRPFAVTDQLDRLQTALADRYTIEREVAY